MYSADETTTTEPWRWPGGSARGYVSVNRYGIGPRAPFGGVKRSGIGRESGNEGYDSFLEYVSHPLSPEQAAALGRDLGTG